MADNRENNHELFAAWLAQNAPADGREEIIKDSWGEGRTYRQRNQKA